VERDEFVKVILLGFFHGIPMTKREHVQFQQTLISFMGQANNGVKVSPS
jgi:hypothetical protein